MKKYQSTKAFTIVELIVVVTILAILSTIGFTSYVTFTSKARDGNRLSQIESINNALISYTSKGRLPLPDNKVTITANGAGNIVGYQGEAGESVLNKIGIDKGGKDPSDDKYYTYYLDVTKTKIQLLGFLENDPNEDKQVTGVMKIEGIVKKAQATDYTERYITTYGKKLGILLDTSNNPIQENTTLRTTGLDIVTTTSTYKAVFTQKTTTNSGIIMGTGTQLTAAANPNKSCLTIYQTGIGRTDGFYTINPTLNQNIEVYCDMTTNGGGWTRYFKCNDQTTCSPTNWNKGVDLAINLGINQWMINMWDNINESSELTQGDIPYSSAILDLISTYKGNGYNTFRFTGVRGTHAIFNNTQTASNVIQGRTNKRNTIWYQSSRAMGSMRGPHTNGTDWRGPHIATRSHIFIIDPDSTNHGACQKGACRYDSSAWRNGSVEFFAR